MRHIHTAGTRPSAILPSVWFSTYSERVQRTRLSSNTNPAPGTQSRHPTPRTRVPAAGDGPPSPSVSPPVASARLLRGLLTRAFDADEATQVATDRAEPRARWLHRGLQLFRRRQ
eukprot:scaffold65757_cov56-Phaeocystis_antarctica.AAC.2